MLRDIFRTVGGIEGYGIISMIIFVIFFTLLVLYSVSLKRNDAEEYSRLPLDDLSKESDDIQDI